MLAEDRQIVPVTAEHRRFVFYTRSFSALVETRSLGNDVIGQFDGRTVQEDHINALRSHRGRFPPCANEQPGDGVGKRGAHARSVRSVFHQQRKIVVAGWADASLYARTKQVDQLDRRLLIHDCLDCGR